VSDIVTWVAAVARVTDRTFLVSMACALSMLVTAWYIQVLPTAAGNGIEPDDALELDLAPGVATVVAVPFAVPAPLEVAAAGLLADVAGDVLEGVPHPASVITASVIMAIAITADPEGTARCLLTSSE
jgi:hypothetical protein